MQPFHEPYRVLVLANRSETEAMAKAVLVALQALDSAIEERQGHVGMTGAIFLKRLTQLQESKRTLRELYDALVKN